MAFPPAVMPYLPELIVHISAGCVAILAGYAAVTAAKGERLHRRFGTVFVVAMLIMASMALYLAFSLLHIMKAQSGNIAGSMFALYLVATAWMTVKRKEGTVGPFENFALLVIVGVAALLVGWGVQAGMSPDGKFDGQPAVQYYVFAGLAAFFAALDLKVILRGGISGVARITRHLWRMCFALFIAAGSFFIGQQKIMPDWMQGSPILFALGFAPLLFLFF
ncbi:MAG: DUF2306 domain-containing protein [Alphaproteobacteria bacterium]